MNCIRNLSEDCICGAYYRGKQDYLKREEIEEIGRKECYRLCEVLLGLDTDLVLVIYRRFDRWFAPAKIESCVTSICYDG